MDYSTTICDKTIDAKETNFNEKKVTCKTQNFYILLAFLLITIVLLTTVSVYCYLIEYQGKHLWPFRNTDSKFNKFYIDIINRKWVI